MPGVQQCPEYSDAWNAEKAPTGVVGAFCREWLSGGVLLSHPVPGAVPSALRGLASGFGMVTGRFPLAMAAVTL